MFEVVPENSAVSLVFFTFNLTVLYVKLPFHDKRKTRRLTPEATSTGVPERTAVTSAVSSFSQASDYQPVFLKPRSGLKRAQFMVCRENPESPRH